MITKNQQIVKLAAIATKWGRIHSRRSGGWCKSYNPGGRVWNEAIARATAIVESREVVDRKGHAGYVEGFRADGSVFHRGGVGSL